MSEKKAAGTASEKEAAALRPISPVDGALVDVKAVPFEWTGVEGDVEFILQIARDADFDDVVSTISAGETTAVTLYHTIDAYSDEDLYWRVRAGKTGPWGPTATFHAAGSERLQAEIAERNRIAQAEAREARRPYLEKQERMPVSLPEDQDSSRHTALILGLIVMSFVILLVILLIFGWITYPADAQL